MSIQIDFDDEAERKSRPEAGKTQARAYTLSDSQIESEARQAQSGFAAEMQEAKSAPGPRDFEFPFSSLAEKLAQLELGKSDQLVHGFSSVKIGISTKHIKTYEIDVRHPDPYLAADVAKELSTELDRLCENPFI